jgi:hypothetical protein
VRCASFKFLFWEVTAREARASDVHRLQNGKFER